MKKVISLILCLVFLFSMCGCSSEETLSGDRIPEKVKKGYTDNITLLYSDSDTFNPYTAKTETNRTLCKLLYEPLVKLDNNFKPHNSLAKSVKTVKDECTVTLKDIKFSDGSQLTAKDVVYSYKLAIKSSTEYKYKLYEVTSATAKNDNTVVFKLEKNDPYFVNVLDFPIIKAGSEKKEDSDGVKAPPIGCGRYRLSDDQLSLTQNSKYHGKKGSVKTINLINAPDNEAVAHYVEVGATDIYYSDISDGTIHRMSGNKTDINLNNLVYIGVNHKNKKLAINELRQALSTAIDREKIVKGAFYGNATSATGFFHPNWEPTLSIQNIQITANSQITIENLEQIGYNELDKDGCRRKNNSALRFSLLVNKENQMRVTAANLIAKQLKEYGILVSVVKVPYKTYKKRLKNNDFDLYLGEVKLTENMDFYNLVSVKGSASFGIEPKKKKTDDTKTDTKKESSKELLDCAKVIEGFYKGENSINDVAVTLQSDMPIIPVCYRTGVLFCDENIENVKNASASDIYFSIESYKIKLD